ERACFFFQAEDGIRDFHVTGVQTCALPISRLVGVRPRLVAEVAKGRPKSVGDGNTFQATAAVVISRFQTRTLKSLPPLILGCPEIGRASCRERVKISVDAVSLRAAGWNQEG